MANQLIDCVAEGNQSGGFRLESTATHNTVQGCEAYGDAGFTDLAPADSNVFISNISRTNTIAYSGVANTVSLPLTATTSPLANIQ